MPYWRTGDIKPLPTGPSTPWPNCAETAVKLFQIQLKQIAYTLYCQDFLATSFLTARMLILRACWARNNSLTYGGKTPLECAFGRRPPDIVNAENETFGSHAERLSATGTGPEGYHKSNISKRTDFVNADLKLQRIALEAHLQARQIYDMQRDFAAKLEYPTYTQIKEGDPVWY